MTVRKGIFISISGCWALTFSKNTFDSSSFSTRVTPTNISFPVFFFFSAILFSVDRKEALSNSFISPVIRASPSAKASWLTIHFTLWSCAAALNTWQPPSDVPHNPIRWLSIHACFSAQLITEIISSICIAGTRRPRSPSLSPNPR